MDVKDFVNNVVYQPEKIRREFYWEKAKALFGRQGNDSSLPKMEVKNKNLIDTIKKYFPEATIYSDFLIEMKNVDFRIGNSGRRKYIGAKGKGWFYISDIPNIVEFMKETDRLMPEWEKEFADMMARQTALYENEIRKEERESVLNGTSIGRILSNRLDVQLMGCREKKKLVWSSFNKQFPEANASLKNISVEKNNHWDIMIRINARNDCWNSFREVEIDMRFLERIDNLVPAWIDECEQWEYEYEKLKKSHEIKEMGVKTLIKQKMKQFGYEYNITPNNQSITLYIKLEKTRMFKLSLPYRSIEVVNKRLDMIAETVKAVNNIDNAFRITNEQKFIRWERESQR